MTPHKVLTPGGYRPRSKVHEVAEGCHLQSENGQMFIVDSGSGRRLQNLGPSPKKHPRRHAGRSALRSAMFAAGPFTSSPVPILNNGWVAYAEWIKVTGPSLTQFMGQWTVPPPPAIPSGQTIFIFIGLQNTEFIMQPVLQWGPSGAGGGQKWSIANWYAGNDMNHTAHHGITDVNEGDVLQARIQLVSQNDRSFKYSASFDGFPSLDLVQPDVIELFHVSVVLETHNLTSPGQFPATQQTQVQNLQVLTGISPGQPTQTARPAWQLTPQDPASGQPHSVIASGGKTIDLNYGTSNVPAMVVR